MQERWEVFLFVVIFEENIWSAKMEIREVNILNPAQMSEDTVRLPPYISKASSYVPKKVKKVSSVFSVGEPGFDWGHGERRDSEGSCEIPPHNLRGK